MKNITIFGNGFGKGIVDENVDMWYYSENDCLNPKFLGNVFPFIGRYPIEKFYEYGIMGESEKFDFIFVQQFNEYMKKYNVITIIPLTTYSVFFEYVTKKGKKIDYFGINDRYEKYLNHLLDGIEKIDLSKIDFIDVLKFDLSDEEKILTTQKIKIVNLKSNQKKLYIHENNVINYLLHILPQYLPDNMKLNSSIFDVIDYDEDEIFFKFRNLVRDKSYQYINDIKTKNQCS